MRSFQSRNPVRVAVAGLGAIAAVLVTALNANHLPFIGDGPTYHADFAEVGSLRVGEEVRVAGISVGAVDSVRLDGAHVSVGFHVNRGTRVGSLTTASIEIKTVLGAEYLALHPAGPGRLSSTIPLSRTVPPFEIAPAFNQLTSTVTELDTAALAKALSTLTSTFRNSPQDVHAALTGLNSLSTAIASRDAQLQDLFTQLRVVTGTVAANAGQITSIIDSSNTLLGVLAQRAQTIDQLLTSTRDLAVQLSGVIKDNRAHLAPALASLNRVSAVLVADRTQLSQTIARLEPFVRVFTDALGTGGFFDATIKFGSNMALCDTSVGNSPLSAALDPVLSAMNQASSGNTAPCLPLAAPKAGG